MLVFKERGKQEYLEKNLSEHGENQQQTQPTYCMTPGLGIEHRPHWWGVSAHTTVPPLLPSTVCSPNEPSGMYWSVFSIEFGTGIAFLFSGVTLKYMAGWSVFHFVVAMFGKMTSARGLRAQM